LIRDGVGRRSEILKDLQALVVRVSDPDAILVVDGDTAGD
jgi:hypothetical protein